MDGAWGGVGPGIGGRTHAVASDLNGGFLGRGGVGSAELGGVGAKGRVLL